MADQGRVARRRVCGGRLSWVLDKFDDEETTASINGLQKKPRAHDAFPTKPVLFMRLILLLFDLHLPCNRNNCTTHLTAIAPSHFTALV